MSICRSPTPAVFNHVNAIHRTGGQTEGTTGTVVGYDAVQMFGASGNGGGRTDFGTPGTADTVFRSNAGNGKGDFMAVLGIKLENRALEKRGQPGNAGSSARGAAVDRGLVIDDGRGIGPAAIKAALAALRLWQQVVDRLNK